MKRLSSLEGIVRELGGHVEVDGNVTTNGSPEAVPNGGSHCENSAKADPPLSGHARLDNSELDGEILRNKEMGALMLSDEGRSRYVKHTFFSRLTEEVDDIVQLMFGESKEEEDSPPSPDFTTPGSEHQSFVFGYSSSQVNVKDLHPLPSHLPIYLQMYAQKVDPLVKILHIPTIKVIIMEAARDLGSLSPSSEALLFALYFAVITSMSQEEVKDSFAIERKDAYHQYRFGVEQALARAKFLDSSDLVTLQAFVLYLAVVRCEDASRAGWALVRSAIGIAQSLGLHRDGILFGLSPLDIEMRRRLWWQLCIVDFRLSDRHGTDPSIDAVSFDTKRPLNINDSDLLPDAKTLPEPRSGLTEMTITLICCEVSSAAITLLRPLKDATIGADHVAGKEERIRQFCAILEEKYVRHCTDGSATAWIASKLCGLVICKLESMLLLPLTRSEKIERDATSHDLYDKMFISSIEVVELRRDLEADIAKDWHWYMRTIIQWHAVAFILSELCVRQPDDNVTRAWRILDLVLQDFRDLQQHGAPVLLMAPMKKLIARARQKRAQDLEALRAVEAAKQLSEYVPIPSMPANDVPPALDYFPGTQAMLDLQRSSHNVTNAGYVDHQQHWLVPQPYVTPTPWLLKDSALQELGIDLNGLEANMEWEGLNDLVQQMEPAYGSNVHGPFSGW
ncbi:unnamed protein product [Diplocarpon coronariae]|uniref:Xylanolytic transcriptional activator regulatory domain-containing protein n=1 Tax=Diplocarpon coronariae TaxID=2795749 RepID=A0A218YWN2_9HELO|nr:hypothetical protein JHW43_007473 [Diplocarpon mali]OWO99701.1 hypothetical protein B2J93_9451 [Marssonina coronariae]